MAKVDPREALEVLTRARLIELAQGFELDVKKSSSKDALIDAVLRRERGGEGGFEAVLEALSRSELKEICRANGLSDKGKEKAGIVGRILGREAEGGGSEQLALGVEAGEEAEGSEVREGKKARGRPRKRREGEDARGEQGGAGDGKAGNGGVLGFESQLWSMADQLWTNSALQPSECSTPVLALIFLKYADHKFAQAEAKLRENGPRRRGVTKDDYLAEGVLYVPEKARFKASKFVLDWRKKARARAGVRTTIQSVLDALPKAYSDELYEEKCSQIYEHCYESYYGDGASKYAAHPARPDA